MEEILKLENKNNSLIMFVLYFNITILNIVKIWTIQVEFELGTFIIIRDCYKYREINIKALRYSHFMQRIMQTKIIIHDS